MRIPVVANQFHCASEGNNKDHLTIAGEVVIYELKLEAEINEIQSDPPRNVATVATNALGKFCYGIFGW